MSELVVDGRCLVAFLVCKDQVTSGELVRSEWKLSKAGLVNGANCFVSVLRSSSLKHTFLFPPKCGIAAAGLPVLVRLSPHPQDDTSPQSPPVFSSILRCWMASRY